MIQKIADNIYSPLGPTTDSNYLAVYKGRSMLRKYDGGMLGVPEPFTASLFDWPAVESAEGCTPFERIAIASIDRALARADVDVRSEGLLFILSTTKGNVGLLGSGHPVAPRVALGAAAQHIASYFGFRRQPLVVSNACISGLSAQLTAMRLLEGGYCDTAIVCGADVQSRFIVSGFGSLKALSPVECRPFDIERCGLNLGEAAATIIYRSSCNIDIDNDEEEATWVCTGGAVCNDAHHVSSPSPKGEGCYMAIRAAMGDLSADSLAFVNAHGTATLFNDEMEAVALSRAGLLGVPVNSLKGFYGHTMGAAGVLETVLSMRAIDRGTILGTRGFHELGISQPLSVSACNRPTTKQSFLKLLSGFGGGNAAMVFERIEKI